MLAIFFLNIIFQIKMRLARALYAKHFGELGTVRGILTYKLSPFEQRAFAGAISHGVPNIFRRIASKIGIVAPRKLKIFKFSYESI